MTVVQDDAPDLVDWMPDRSKLWLNPAVHQFFYELRLIGMRDRLRCPECGAVGTWKPHGTPRDRRKSGDRPVRRWMCKCCGLYQGPEGTLRVYPDRQKGVWVLPERDVERQPTPKELLNESRVWPWHG